MPVITKIVEQKRSPNRRNIYIDGRFAFGVNENIIVKLGLCIGQDLSSQRITQIEAGEVRQECFDQAMQFLRRRLHSRSELSRKLMKQEYGEPVVKSVLDKLQQLGYVDDERFAKTKALSAAEHKHHGRRRAFVELRRAGVSGDVADRALDSVYDTTDTVALARELALKQAPRLRKLDPLVAKRRLVGMLQRRGFDYDAIKPVIDEVLGKDRE
jgi:regulatory protein